MHPSVHCQHLLFAERSVTKACSRFPRRSQAEGRLKGPKPGFEPTTNHCAHLSTRWLVSSVAVIFTFLYRHESIMATELLSRYRMNIFPPQVGFQVRRRAVVVPLIINVDPLQVRVVNTSVAINNPNDVSEVLLLVCSPRERTFPFGERRKITRAAPPTCCSGSRPARICTASPQVSLQALDLDCRVAVRKIKSTQNWCHSAG